MKCTYSFNSSRMSQTARNYTLKRATSALSTQEATSLSLKLMMLQAKALAGKTVDNVKAKVETLDL